MKETEEKELERIEKREQGKTLSSIFISWFYKMLVVDTCGHLFSVPSYAFSKWHRKTAQFAHCQGDICFLSTKNGLKVKIAHRSTPRFH